MKYEYYKEWRVDNITNETNLYGVYIKTGMRGINIGLDTILDMLMVFQDNGYDVKKIVQEKLNEKR